MKHDKESERFHTLENLKYIESLALKAKEEFTEPVNLYMDITSIVEHLNRLLIRTDRPVRVYVTHKEIYDDFMRS